MKSKGLILLVGVGLLFCMGVAEAQTSLLLENFEGTFPPTGWTTNPSWPTGWMRNSTAGYSNYSGGGGYCAIRCDDSYNIFPPSTNPAWLRTPTINCSTYPTVWLAYNIAYNNGGSDRASVEVSTNGGVSWTTIPGSTSPPGPTPPWSSDRSAYGPGIRDSVNISALVGSQPNVMVRFSYWEVSSVWGWWYEIDRVWVWGSGGATNADVYMKSGSLVFTGQPTTGLAVNQVWCGAAYTPRDTVGNNGPGTATSITTQAFIDAWSAFGSSIPSLASGAVAGVSFSNWTATLIPGTTHNRRDTTYAASPSDPNLANNKQAATITDVYDGETVSINSPPLTVVVGNTYTPQATVRNSSLAGAATFTVICTILPGGYTDTRTVTNLAFGTNTTVNFNNWTVPAGTSWTVTVVCNAIGDINLGNNAKSITCSVGTPTTADLQMKLNSLFLSGTFTGLGAGQVWCGAAYSPRDTVFNNGPATANTITTISYIDAWNNTAPSIASLASGAQQQVSFAAWTASLIPNTVHNRRDTTYLASPTDPDLTNNKRTATYTAVYDGQAVSITNPPANPWCGATYAPAATVRNNSSAGSATFTVTCTINPGGYSNTQTVTNLAAATNTTVNFANWTASQTPNTAYTVTVTCNTTGDVNTANNTVSTTVTTVYDGQTVSVDNPPTNPWCGATYSPSATVRNNSALGSATFTVTCTITGGYTSTKTVTALNALTNTTVTFDPWTASRVPGTPYTVTVTCQTTGDNNTANNTGTRNIATVYDGQAIDIDAPPDTVMTGTLYTPEATVRNNSGAGTADFSATCTIDPSGYSSTINITNLGFGVSSQAVFAGWTSPLAAGVTYTMTVTVTPNTNPPDVNPANNIVTKSILAWGDVGAFEPHYPLDEVYVDTDIFPVVMLRNFTGGTTEGFNVTIQAEDEGGGIAYEDVTPTETMTPNQDRECYAATAWHTPNEVGKHFLLHAFTQLPGDCQPMNDQVDWEVVTVAKAGSDVRPKSINSPANLIAGDPYTPKATVENPGTNPGTFWTYCTIDASFFTTAYLDSVLVNNLAPGDTIGLSFADWTAEAGSFVLRVYTALTGDEHPENDTATLRLTSTGIAESKEAMPTTYILQLSKPNPFYNTTEIRYGLPVTSRISLAIYDITGKLVKTLVNGTENLGFHKVIWNGLDNAGRRVGTGLYFIRFESSSYTATQKLILITR